MERSNSYMPDLRLRSLAVDFIDNRLDKYHPAFATPPARYDPALDSFIVHHPSLRAVTMQPESTNWQQPNQVSLQLEVGAPGLTPRPPEQPAKALKFWNSIFEPAMVQFASGAKEPKGRVAAGFSIRDKSNWSAVFDQLVRAKETYANLDDTSGTFRRGYRCLADGLVLAAFGLSKLMPSSDCMSVTPVLGAVQIILETVKEAAKVRKTMEGSFDDIDTMLADIELHLQTFPGDESIKRASIDLIVAVFAAIESVIGFFTKHTFKRVGGAILRRDEYESEVLAALKAVQTACQRLTFEGNKSEKWMISEGMQQIPLMRQEQKDSFKTLADDLLKELEANREGDADWMEVLAAYRKERDSLLKIIDVQARARSPSPGPPSYASVAKRHISPEQLLGYINIPDVAAGDLHRIDDKRLTLVSRAEQASAEQLMRSDKLKQWMVCATSSQLLVHGNYQGRRDVSGLSLFCTSLVQSLRDKSAHFIPLVFFCGLHTNTEDEDEDQVTGGRAIVQSFICQLLCAFDFDTRALVDEKLDEGLIEDGDVDELCRLLEWLVKKLPRSVVLFCVLDGVLYYEREEFQSDMDRVVVTLLQVSSEEKTDAAVKVLLTSPRRTSLIRQPFPDELILSMESAVRSSMAPSKGRLERELSESHQTGLDEQG